MPRRKAALKRERTSDPLYQNTLVTRLINVVMKRGKKSVAEAIVYRAFDIMKEKSSGDSLSIFLQAMENIKPLLEVKSRRVGGATYQVPVEVAPERRISLALRWLINYARQRKEKTMAQRLAFEILDASKNEGLSIKKKEDTHRMAEANKAFAHYRW